jgi:hypothetical protein
MNRTNFALAFFLAAVVVGLLVRYNVRMPLPREHFMQKDAGMPLDAPGMGPYDQTGMGGWASTESAMPVGTAPVATPLDSNQLMLFASNKVGPECCPSALSNDMGCVCLTGADQDFMAKRGGNK